MSPTISGRFKYAKLSIEADKHGSTLSAYVRKQLADKRQTIETEAALARIEAKLHLANRVAVVDPILIEVLLLVRELVADRNPQVLPRIASRLNAQYPERRDV